MDECYIRGSTIKYCRIPDEVCAHIYTHALLLAPHLCCPCGGRVTRQTYNTPHRSLTKSRRRMRTPSVRHTKTPPCTVRLQLAHQPSYTHHHHHHQVGDVGTVVAGVVVGVGAGVVVDEAGAGAEAGEVAEGAAAMALAQVEVLDVVATATRQLATSSKPTSVLYPWTVWLKTKLITQRAHTHIKPRRRLLQLLPWPRSLQSPAPRGPACRHSRSHSGRPPPPAH